MDGWGGALAQVVSAAIAGADVSATTAAISARARPVGTKLDIPGSFVVFGAGSSTEDPYSDGSPTTPGGGFMIMREAAAVKICLAADTLATPRVSLYRAARLARVAVYAAGGWVDVEVDFDAEVEYAQSGETAAIPVGGFTVSGRLSVGLGAGH